ncbi:uncharacterized protein SOCE836_049060 [Sorangium cellulosum]|uniref:Uncharacterized protein n=1 Tax=Sorangium cellulosum TaxID=56 RepID=A0A4P2QRA6_SORCE|nr:uncharacterized protein SOCE836_049060 [Sorangium cellulosum]WCQ92135.1 hypothetical protein NQZ70_04870 [Sorangium sp. Soce836]
MPPSDVERAARGRFVLVALDTHGTPRGVPPLQTIQSS